MNKLRNFGTFAGIGGMELGLERTGAFETVAFCEINSFCQKVLGQHWPGVPIIGDIRNAIESLERIGITKGDIDSITGGFPCQPFSRSGKQQGRNDNRYLWPELANAIRYFRPQYVLLENVPDLLSIERGGVFGDVLRDLASCGYDAEWQVLPASAFGATQKRERVFIVAYPHRVGMERSISQEVFRQSRLPSRQVGELLSPFSERFNTLESRLCRSLHVLPFGVDRVRSLGNAVVPVVAEWVAEQVAAHHQSKSQ